MEYILIDDIDSALEHHISHFKDDDGNSRLNCINSISEFDSYSTLKNEIDNQIDYDIIVINLDSSVVGNSTKSGIDILKYIRFKCKRETKIISVSFNELSDWIIEKATNSILVAPNNYYLQLPVGEKKLDFILFGTGSELKQEKLKEAYVPFVYPDFDFKKYNHSFANSYGFYVMEKFYKSFFKKYGYDLNDLNDDQELDFAKADFLFKHSTINDRQKERLDEAYRLINQETSKCIVHIDDEGKDQWYKLFASILENSTYKPINDFIIDTNNGRRINKEVIINKLEEINDENPVDLILIDLRLLEKDEDNKPIEQLSGANLIITIRKVFDNSVPIILVSATDRLKNMSVLQEYPYNVNNFWQKPRIDKGKLNLAIIYIDLLTKIEGCLNLFNLPITKVIAGTKYDLKRLNLNKKPKHLCEEISDYNYYVFDTNYFCETSPKYRDNMLAFYNLFKTLNQGGSNKRIVLIQDVFSEIFLNSIKEKIDSGKDVLLDLSATSTFSLEIIKSIKNSPYINDMQDQVVDSNRINKLAKEPKFNPDTQKYEVIFTKKETEEVFSDKEMANKFIELSKSKKLLHADRTFKELIKHQIDHIKKKVLFISDDKGCRYGIAKGLDFGGRQDEYQVSIARDLKNEEYLRYTIPKEKYITIEAKNKKGKVTMVNNETFCEMI